MLIALDAMGGDHAPEEPCKAAIQACQHDPELSVALVGDSERIKPIIEKADASVRSRLSIVHTDEVITGSDSPSLSIRRPVALDTPKEELEPRRLLQHGALARS